MSASTNLTTPDPHAHHKDHGSMDMGAGGHDHGGNHGNMHGMQAGGHDHVGIYKQI